MRAGCKEECRNKNLSERSTETAAEIKIGEFLRLRLADKVSWKALLAVCKTWTDTDAHSKIQKPINVNDGCWFPENLTISSGTVS